MFAVGTEGEAADAADVGDEILKPGVENLGIEFAHGFPRADAPLADAAEEIAADEVASVAGHSEAEDAFGVPFKLGDGFAIGGLPHLDDGVVPGANEIFAVRRERKRADIVAVGVGDRPERFAGAGVVPAMNAALIISREQALLARMKGE